MSNPLSYVDQLEGSFQGRLSQIFELSKLPTNILALLENPIENVEIALTEIEGSEAPKNTVRDQITVLKSLTNNKQIEDQFKDFNSQIIVLMVGAMEAHLYDVVKSIGDNNPEMFVFQSGGDKEKKIIFEASLLGEKTSVGEIMRHYFKEHDGGVSFQDVQSINRFFSDRLLCDLDMEDVRDALIFATAARNAIVHNNQIIDRRFINQIRDTPYVDLEIEGDDGKTKKRYIIGEGLTVEFADINATKEALLGLVAEIGVKLREGHES